jgi:hypothetical protein
MWSCLLLTDTGGDPVVFSGVSVVPAGDPIVLLDAVIRAGSDHLLIVAPPALLTPMQTGVTIAAGRRPDLSLSWLASEHAPLAILSALALARATTEEPGIGVELTRRLLASAWSGAWTGSVAKLNSPNPKLTQHLRSWFPGSGFLLRQSPEPAVLGKPRQGDVPSVGLDRVLLIQDAGVPSPVAERLSGADGVSAVRQVALPGAWTSVYGTDRTGQLALMPAEPRPMIGTVSHRCPACRLDLISAVCPFCRIVATPVKPAATATAPGAGTGSAAGTGPATGTPGAEAVQPAALAEALATMTPMSGLSGLTRAVPSAPAPRPATNPATSPATNPAKGPAGPTRPARPPGQADPAQPGGPA